jgi:hypothetical protein
MNPRRPHLPALALVGAVLGMLLPGAGPGQDAGPPEPAPPAADPADDERLAKAARVVVRVDRFSEVMGRVELEDDNVIVLRRVDNGQLESFSKRRIVRVIRLVDTGEGRHGVVVLRNGEQREGLVIEDGFEHVVIEIEGVRATFRREVVDHVRLTPSVDDRYLHFKATLKPEMADRHLDLCRWLVSERRYELALLELDDLLTRHALPEARELRRLVRAQLALKRDAKPRGAGAAPSARDEPDDERPMAASILSRDDVNLIRVYEIDFERPPKVVVRKDTIRELLDANSTSTLLPPPGAEREALLNAEALDIVQLMFSLRARGLYPQVEVQTEPHALNLFRQRVHNVWLMNNCATSRCHGGTDAGRFFLHRRNYKDARVRYTNLLILERLELDPEWPLVNYERPMDSLIIQHGLARSQAVKPHPPVSGWRPVFRRRTDRAVTSTIRWIESMMQPRIDYPVEFEPPQVGGDPGAAGDPARTRR